jgi:hypothetical protein
MPEISSQAALLRAGARGLVAAMAMTGARTVTTGVVPEEVSPPVAIVERRAPGWFGRLSGRRREALTELMHWAYGAAGGMLFGALPATVRSRPAIGPVYGLGIWLAFELGISPALGIAPTRRRHVLWRGMIAADHVLYGLVVAGRLAPEPAVAHGRPPPRSRG